MCAYGCLIIREARKHGGYGWAAYDAQFRRIAAARPETPWAALYQSLHASTFLTTRTGTGTHCRHCAEADHQSLAPVRAPPPHLSESAMEPSFSGCGQEQPRVTPHPPPPPQPRPICTLWNRVNAYTTHPTHTGTSVRPAVMVHTRSKTVLGPRRSVSFRRPYPPATPAT